MNQGEKEKTMHRKQWPGRSLPLGGLALSLLLGLACSAGAADDRGTLKGIKDGDTQLQSGYTLEALLQRPAHPFDPEQGRELRSVRQTGDEKGRASAGTSRHSREPKYQSLHVLDYKSLDFDDQDHLIYWRTSKVWHLSAGALNRTLVEWETGTVSPAGEVANRTPHTQLQRYAAEDPNSLPEANHLLMILGRGFSPHLHSIESTEKTSDGLHKLEVEGSYGEAHPGTWELWVDTGANFLVRRARFSSAATGHLVLEMHNSGLAEGGVPLALSGWIEFPLDQQGRRAPYRVEADLQQYRGVFDRRLWREVQGAVTRTLPDGSEILDLVEGQRQRIFIGE
jgi:hypothetical protein